LSFWKVAAEELDYRRFFNINELISLRVEDEKVFRHSHTLISNSFGKANSPASGSITSTGFMIP